MRENIPIRLAVATSSTLVREGICKLLETEKDIEILGTETSTQVEIIQIVEQKEPEVLFIDTSISKLDVVEILELISRRCARTKVLLLLHTSDEETVIKAISLGVQGCLKETSNAEEFIKAIRALSKDEIWAEIRIITKALTQLLPARRRGKLVLKAKLTVREEEIVKCVLQGCSNKQIAKNLFLSEKTIKAHLTNVFNKLGVSNRLHIVLNLFGESTFRYSPKSSPEFSPRDIAEYP